MNEEFRFLGEEKDFSLLKILKAGPRSHAVSYPIVIGSSPSKGKEVAT
jgi:hypothetical protein